MRTLANILGSAATAAVIAVAASLPVQASVTTTCSTTVGSVNCSARIPDAVGNTPGSVSSTMTVAACGGGATASGVAVAVNISHTWVGDLQITLTNPSATSVTLLSNLPDASGSVGGCQDDNVLATFADGAASPTCAVGLAGTIAPSSPLSPFGAAPIPGVWTLTVKDTQASSDGILNDWSIVALCVTLDIDGNKTADGLTDGLMVLRYLFGITGPQLTSNALGNGATRTDPAVVKAYLDQIRPQLDIDNNGTVDALTDGLLIVRYLLGLRGNALISGAIGPGAMRNTAALIEPYLQSLTQ